MPIDLKQSLLSGYHSIAGDYTAFSEREKSFPRENAQAACECCAARAYTTLALSWPQLALPQSRKPPRHESLGNFDAVRPNEGHQEGAADAPCAIARIGYP